MAMTSADLVSMPDGELANVDPLVMNLIVARGIPEVGNLDIPKYAKIVDAWASQIEAANRAAEPLSKNDPAYLVSREFWLAGGMAVMLAGPAFGISYTRDNLNPGSPDQQFIHGVIDNRKGTCATMPVLYMAIGRRLGWPIKAVVSGDHMWARWDDGVPVAEGGKRFNLEATNARSEGGEGSFASLTDDQYIQWLETPRGSIEGGSDMTSLTPRQVLGVFLQGRAGYWVEHKEPAKAEADLRVALECFPQNRDIRRFHAWVKSEVTGRSKSATRSRGGKSLDVERINRQHQEARERLLPPLAQPVQNPTLVPSPIDPGFQAQPPG